MNEDTDLDAIRSPAELAKLDEDERKSMEKLWKDIAALRQDLSQARIEKD